MHVNSLPQAVLAPNTDPVDGTALVAPCAFGILMPTGDKIGKYTDANIMRFPLITQCNVLISGDVCSAKVGSDT
jgi:hypothetical protein